MKALGSLSIGILVCLTLTVSAATGAVPPLVNYQGILTDAGGNPITATVTVRFRIYDQPSIGTVLFNETQSVTPDAAGRINVNIGNLANNLSHLAFSGANRWLGVTVGGDPELVPRVRLTTVPYAFRVATVDGAEGGDVIGDLGVQGTVFIKGTAGVDGVEFADGTLQTTAPSAGSLTYTAANTFRFTTTGTADQTLTNFVPAPSLPFTERFITGIWIDGQNTSSTIFAEFSISGSTVLRLDDHTGAVGMSQTFWMSGGGAPLVLSGGQTLSVDMDVNGTSGTGWSLTITGYDQ